MKKDKLIEKLFKALDDEVLFHISQLMDLSEFSIEVLQDCEKLGYKSKALKELNDEGID